jgi:hypothetical protein
MDRMRVAFPGGRELNQCSMNKGSESNDRKMRAKPEEAMRMAAASDLRSLLLSTSLDADWIILR